MKKRILSVMVVVASVILMLFVAKQESETKYVPLEQRNAVPNIETTTANKKSIDKKVLNNYKQIDKSLELINKKLEIVKNVIPNEYNQLNQLENEIESLNLIIEESKMDISKSQDINDDTIKNLEAVNSSLTQLIDTFKDEDNNIYFVKIVSISDNFIEAEYNKEIYKITTNNTLYDGTIAKNNNALIICDKKITQNNVNCLIFIMQ